MRIFIRRSIWLYISAILTLYLLSYFSLVAIGDKRYVCIAPSGFDTIVTWPSYCYSDDLHEIHSAAESGIHPELTVTGYIFYPVIYIQEIAHIHSFYHTMNDQERLKFESDARLGNVDVHDVNNSRYFVDNGKHIENPMLSMDFSNAPEYEDTIRHLLSTHWKIIHTYNVIHHPIIFENNGKFSDDGDLQLNGHGSWRFRNGKLEIYSEYGEMFYSLTFDKEANEFRSTKVGNAKSQTIMVPFTNDMPPNGYVPDAASAVAIALAIFMPIYGDEKIKGEMPFTAELMDGVWHVEGYLPPNVDGGVAEVSISQNDGKVLRVFHGK